MIAVSAFGGNNTRGPIDVATACNAHGSASGRMDFETETFVAHTLRADGFDASEDGTGRGTPLVPVAFKERGRGQGERNIEWQEDQAYCLRAVAAGGCRDEMNVAVPTAYQCHGNNVGPMGTLRQGDGGLTSGVPFTIQSEPKCFNWQAGGSKAMIGYGDQPTALQAKQIPALQQGMAVRRLTPVECERLQGFPDDYTAIPWRNKPAEQCPYGPRYKALGNSFAVPVIRWIGERIQLVDSLEGVAR